MRNLQGLTSFLESASCGSFTAAAARLDLTPAAVSKNVMRLEAELGVRLFNRHTRRIRLTPEGEAFAEQAREALRRLDAALDGVRETQAEPAGRVRISVGLSFGRTHVLPALPPLLARHPKLEVEVSLDNRPVDLVAEGFDISIRGGFIQDSSLVARRICALPMVLVASPGYLKRHGTPRSVAELAGHELLGTRFPGGQGSVWKFRRSRPSGGGATEFMPPARLWVSDPEAQLGLALSGAGILQLGLHHAWADLRAGRLSRVLPELHDPDARELVLHYPHRQFLSPRVRVVAEALLQHFQQCEPLHQQP